MQEGNSTKKGKLSVIATPIGNLGDITLRAIETLKASDVILCEDTRVTRKLLSHFDISKNTVSYHAHSGEGRTEEILNMLKEGKNISLVSDAGTPGISDPGASLVAEIREKMSAEIISGEVVIESVPGPSALTAALSVAGMRCAEFTFLGFMPHKKGRETAFKEIVASERMFVFYESPHRIMKTLDSLVEHLGVVEGQREGTSAGKKVAVVKEITKIFEEVVSGDATYVRDYFANNPDKVRGEFVVIVS